MRYLEAYNESSKSRCTKHRTRELKKNDLESIKDILCSISDEGFEIDYENLPRSIEIAIVKGNISNTFKYDEIKETIDQLKSYFSDKYRFNIQALVGHMEEPIEELKNLNSINRVKIYIWPLKKLNESISESDLDEIYYLFIDYVDKYDLIKSEDESDFGMNRDSSEYEIYVANDNKEKRIVINISFQDDYGLAAFDHTNRFSPDRLLDLVNRRENSGLSEEFNNDMNSFFDRLRACGYKVKSKLWNDGYLFEIIIDK